MSELAAAYVTEISEGRVPGEFSEEAIAYREWRLQEQAKEHRAWAWAQSKMAEIRWNLWKEFRGL